jgi:HSP20 family protein
MNLIPWQRRGGAIGRNEVGLPSSFIELRHAMDRFLDRMPSLEWPEWSEGGRTFLPSIDIVEEDDEIVVTAEVPGMDPEDIDIRVSGEELSIHGEKRERTETNDGGRHHCERRYGMFTRRIELPSSADMDSVEAEQHEGVLAIKVKKHPETTSRHIDVRGGKSKDKDRDKGKRRQVAVASR